MQARSDRPNAVHRFASALPSRLADVVCVFSGELRKYDTPASWCVHDADNVVYRVHQPNLTRKISNSDCERAPVVDFHGLAALPRELERPCLAVAQPFRSRGSSVPANGFIQIRLHDFGVLRSSFGSLVETSQDQAIPTPDQLSFFTTMFQEPILSVIDEGVFCSESAAHFVLVLRHSYDVRSSRNVYLPYSVLMHGIGIFYFNLITTTTA